MALPGTPNDGVTQISMSQVNTELGRTSTQLIDLNDSAVRTLAQVGGSGTIISLNNLHGRSSAVDLGDVHVQYSDPTSVYTGRADMTIQTTGLVSRAGSASAVVSYGPTTAISSVINTSTNWYVRSTNIVTQYNSGTAGVALTDPSGGAWLNGFTSARLWRCAAGNAVDGELWITGKIEVGQISGSVNAYFNFTLWASNAL